jgi:hypothetical protein
MTVNSRLEELCNAFPEFDGDFTPPWGLPTADDFVRISLQFACPFPQSFIDFQTVYAARLPIPDNGFRWANSNLEPYLSLEATIEFARQWGMAAHYVPFWDSEGNFCCFDTSSIREDQEFPVVFWEHDAPGDDLSHQWPDFVAWFSEGLEKLRLQKRRY